MLNLSCRLFSVEVDLARLYATNGAEAAPPALARHPISTPMPELLAAFDRDGVIVLAGVRLVQCERNIVPMLAFKRARVHGLCVCNSSWPGLQHARSDRPAHHRCTHRRPWTSSEVTTTNGARLAGMISSFGSGRKRSVCLQAGTHLIL